MTQPTTRMPAPNFFEIEMMDGHLTSFHVDGRDLGLPTGMAFSFSSEELPILLRGLGRERFSFWGNLVTEESDDSSLGLSFRMQVPPHDGTLKRPACGTCGGIAELFLGNGSVTVKGPGDFCIDCQRWDGARLSYAEIMELRR